MIEMIVVIIIIGVLAAVAVPRVMDKSEFESYAFNDEAQSVVRYAQKTAIAQRRAVYVVIAPGSIQACFTDASCATSVPDPSKPGAGLAATAPSGTTLAPATSFFFNGLGEPSFAGNLTVTMASSISRQFTVQAQTGLVHP